MKVFLSICMGCIFTLFTVQISTEAAINIEEQNTMSVLWYQTSGEARALYYQGYKLGKMRLLEAIRNKPKEQGKPLAVILDLDETVLDNSPYRARKILSGRKDRELWEKWVQKAEALPLPGAIDFLTYANGKGVDIYYVSNRMYTHMNATVQNLKRIGAPQATQEHILLQHPKEAGKEARRRQIAKTRRIVLLMGDNLGDFAEFNTKTMQERNELTDLNKDKFGENFIVFPNPMYGDWEKALYHYENKTDEEKAQIRKFYLHAFQP